MPDATNYYDLLEVSVHATPDQINFAYRRALENLAREGKDGTVEAANIRKAWETLSHPLQRMSYDATLVDRGAELINAGGTMAGESAPAWHAAPWVRMAIGSLAALLAFVAMREYTAAKLGVAGNAARVERANHAAENPDQADPNATPLGVLPRSADEIYSAMTGAVAKVIVSDFNGNQIATGSGVVVAPGIVVTNCHVVEKGTQIQVKFPKESFSASVQQRNVERDLCQLYAGNISARPVAVSSVNTVRVGQKVYAIGSPYGLENTLSEGIVSALREVPGGTVIQTSAPISPGSSGGGLFDQFGNLIGIITFQHKYGQNLNFAVPADWIGTLPKMAGAGNIDYSAPAGGERQAAAPAEPRAGDLITGKWTCVGNIDGTSGNWNVSRSSLEIGNDGKTTKNSYALQSDKLVLFDPRGIVKLDVDEITSDKLAFSDFNGRKVNCTRR